MTRHLLLPNTAVRKHTGGGGGGQTDPGNTGDGTGTTNPTLPTVDAITQSMRPTLPPVATFVVAQDGSGTHTTIGAAYADASASANARAIKRAVLGITTLDDPRTRIDIIVKPGIYTESTGYIPGATAVYALDPTPGSTVINCGQENNGSNIYWEGVDINNVGSGPEPKYAFHLHDGDTVGDCIIFARMSMNNQNPSSGGGTTPVGADGTPGTAIVFHRVTFKSGVYTNLHGHLGYGGGGTCVFSECSYAAGSLYYWETDDLQVSDVWVNKCSALTAGCKGAKTNWHVSADTVLTNPSASYSGHTPYNAGTTVTGVQDQRTDWPVPTGALTATKRTQLGV